MRAANQDPPMGKREASLSDKFDLSVPHQLLSGTQAIVRLVLTQKARDKEAGLNTAGYVTGYRGSPIATIENAFARAQALTSENDIVFHPAVNEDLAATAIWGAQQAELRGEGKYDGVFAIWYGKGPGVDRSGDAFRHANHAGTSKHGGVLALLGDDHTCESSTSAHQSEFALVDAMIPILNPAGVQEVLDYGLYGIALSRYAGVWVGLKCVKDNFESTSTVDASPDRIQIHIPSAGEFPMPPDGVNIRLNDAPLDKEARLHDFKRGAVLTFVRANGLDRIVTSGGANPKIGIVTAGKSYLDTRQALDELGIDEVRANELGLRLYKVAMTWPLEPDGVERFAQGLDLILVIEEKRALIETQVKEQLFDWPRRPQVLGKKDETGNWLFPAKGALESLNVALAIGERILRVTPDEQLAARLQELKALRDDLPAQTSAIARTAYFCAGCPHNSSTVIPDGARAYAGIGCHYLAQWMDRSTEGFTQMGAEGANWIGEAPFSIRRHVFQNIGDGTYVHSGSLAIRAAIAAGTNVTYKILYNDAVAMTGGQKPEGNFTVAQMAAQMLAEGAGKVVVVSDEPQKYGPRGLPRGVTAYHRRELMRVQEKLSAIDGVTVLIYDQTCAAEKRRRRKRGSLADPAERVFINPLVCEGCGDCGIKSNCVAILPLETEFGRKRAIDQSACNKDYSCLDGFCPSFVTVTGGQPKRSGRLAIDVDTQQSLPDPALPPLDKPYAILVTGVGGTGVVTISAVLGQAAHLAGLAFGGIDMTGIAQKGGAVACHIKIAANVDAIHAIRIDAVGADLVLGGDLLVTAAPGVIEMIRPGHTGLIYSNHETPTGAFTRDVDFSIPGAELSNAFAERSGGAPLAALDAQRLALAVFGDTLFANMVLLGFAYQEGLVPIPAGAIEQAITLNGAAVNQSIRAFRVGRHAAHDRDLPQRLLSASAADTPLSQTLEDMAALRARELAAYQDDALANRYRQRVADIAALEKEKAPGCAGFAEAVAKSYFKLLAIKDEYEVARLYTDGRFERILSETFEGKCALKFHLAPPFLARKDPATGEPKKITLGSWMLPVLRLLARGKRLRGTWADIFGQTADRRLERRMIDEYETLLTEIAQRLSPKTHATVCALAALPLQIRGYGHVKRTSYEAAKQRENELLSELHSPSPAKRLAAAE